MKNTIITSISALVFLVIGLLIGKSNKQIEIINKINKNQSEPLNLGWQEIPPQLKSVTILIDVDDLKNQLDVESIRNKIELELLRLGLNVKTNYDSDAIIKYKVDTSPIGSSEYISYHSELFILIRSEFEIDSTFYSNLSEIWGIGSLGHFHPENAKNYFSNNLKNHLESMSRDFLRTKNIQNKNL